MFMVLKNVTEIKIGNFLTITANIHRLHVTKLYTTPGKKKVRKNNYFNVNKARYPSPGWTSYVAC